MTWTGFAAAAWRRALIAAAYACVVALAVWGVESGGPVAPVEAVSATSARMDLSIEATFPVARWTVLADGQSVAGTVTNGRWHGQAIAHEILVQAERADPADLSSGAVRVHLGGRDIVGWGEGMVSVTVRP